MDIKITLELTEFEIDIIKTCLVRVRGLLHDADGNQNNMDRECTEDINIIVNRCEEAIANRRAYISTRTSKGVIAMTELRRWEITIIEEEVGEDVLPEQDENGSYVYVIDTEEVVFRDDIANGITLHRAFCDWCNSVGIVPF